MDPLTICLETTVFFVCLAGFFGWRKLKKDTTPLGHQLGQFMLVFMVAIIMVGFPVGLSLLHSTKLIFSGTLLVDSQGQITAAFYQPELLWRFDSRLQDAKIKSFAPVYKSLELKPEALGADGPQAKLCYQFTLKIFGSPKDYLKYQAAVGDLGLASWLENQLQKFNQNHQKELAQFQDPQNKQQQTKFRLLVRKELGSRLEAVGGQMIAVRFDLEK